MSVAILIKYDGVDITEFCVPSASSFTSRANGTPGECLITVKDTAQVKMFTVGKTLELFLDGSREWDGYLTALDYNYWFEGHTSNCKPCDHLTPRKFILHGADRNFLYARRIMFSKTADPFPANKWNAGTSDSTVIAAAVATLLDPADDVNWTSQVETVASPEPYVYFQVPGAGNPFGELMRTVATATGAVYYISPDRFQVYADVNTETAPFEISDNPSAGQVGCRDLTIWNRADEMANDVLIWGAGQGLNQMVFSRVSDATSIATHGRWQHGSLGTNLWKQSSVDRIANSWVYGSPSNKRGHKDDAVSVKCTIFTPGLRVAHKVLFESEVFGFSDVIPVREIAISFPTPTDVKYDLTLSHELDEPWTTDEYWWPTTYTPCGAIDCTYTTHSNPSHTSGSSGLTPAIPSQHVYQNNPRWRVANVLGGPSWIWYTDNPTMHFDNQTPGGNPYNYGYIWFDDILSYAFGGGAPYSWGTPPQGYKANGFRQQGIRQIGMRSWVASHKVPDNGAFPGTNFTARLQGTINFKSAEYNRLHTGETLSTATTPRNGNNAPYIGVPAYVSVQTVRPSGSTTGARWGSSGAALWEGYLSNGQTVALDLEWTVSPKEEYGLTTAIGFMAEGTGFDGQGLIAHTAAVVPTHDVWYGQASLTVSSITYYPNNVVDTVGYDGESPCYPIALCGSVCVDGYRVNPIGSYSISVDGSTLGDTIYVDYPPIYSVQVAYVPGSTKVTIDGMLQVLGTDYTESSPNRGEITLNAALLPSIRGTTLGHEPTIQICFDGQGYTSSGNLPPATGIFQWPALGPITATFGPKASLWPSKVWHGVYYPHFHSGLDIGVGTGSPVYAAADGVLVYVDDPNLLGTAIYIYHSNGMRTLYAHLSSRTVGDGAAVTQGQQIGLSGATGFVTGPHLHFGLHWAGSVEDPLPYIIGG